MVHFIHPNLALFISSSYHSVFLGPEDAAEVAVEIAYRVWRSAYLFHPIMVMIPLSRCRIDRYASKFDLPGQGDRSDWAGEVRQEGGTILHMGSDSYCR